MGIVGYIVLPRKRFLSTSRQMVAWYTCCNIRSLKMKGSAMFLHIDMEVFEERIGISRKQLAHVWDHAEKVVSLRDMVKVESVQVMPLDYLRRLLVGTRLEGDTGEHPYKNCDIKLARMDPASLVVGQTFIERRKYQSLLEGFSDIFHGYCVTRGVAKCNALIVLGRTATNELVIAHYIPPIVEQGDDACLRLLDGVHRNFIVMAVGTTIETIILHGVKVPFPCGLSGWHSLRLVDEKPPRQERFSHLRPELFRDVKFVGIDG